MSVPFFFFLNLLWLLMSVSLSDEKSKLIVLSLVWPNDRRINQVVPVGLGGSLLQSGS